MFLQALVLLRLGHALLLAAVLERDVRRKLGAGLGAALVVLIVLVERLLDVSHHHLVSELLFGLLQVLLHRGGLREQRAPVRGARHDVLGEGPPPRQERCTVSTHHRFVPHIVTQR